MGVLDHRPAEVALVAHEVSVGVPGLYCGPVAQQHLEHLDGLPGPTLDRGEVVTRVVWGGLHHAAISIAWSGGSRRRPTFHATSVHTHCGTQRSPTPSTPGFR